MVGMNDNAVCQLSQNEATRPVAQFEAARGADSLRAQTFQLPDYSETQGTKGITASTNRLLTSMYRGVCWNRKNYRWQASLNNTGRYIYLGSYKTQEEAAAVFDKAALRVRGDRARLNFPRSNYTDANGNLLPEPELDKLLRDGQNPDINPAKRPKTGTGKHPTVDTVIIDDDDESPKNAAIFNEGAGNGYSKTTGVCHTVAQLQSSICNQQSNKGTAVPVVVLTENAVTMPDIGLQCQADMVEPDMMATAQQCNGIADACGGLHTATLIDSATLSASELAASQSAVFHGHSHKAQFGTKINPESLVAARNSNPSAPSSNNSTAMQLAQPGSAQPGFQIRQQLAIPGKGAMHNGGRAPLSAAATVHSQKGQPNQALPMQISEPAALHHANKPLPVQMSEPVNKRMVVYHPTGPVEYSFLRADWQPNSTSPSSQQSPDSVGGLRQHAMDHTPRKHAEPSNSNKRASAGDDRKISERGGTPSNRPALTTQAVLAQAAQNIHGRGASGDTLHSQVDAIDQGIALLATVSEETATPQQPTIPNSTGLPNSQSEPLMHATQAGRLSDSNVARVHKRAVLKDDPASMPLLRDVLNMQKQKQNAALHQPPTPISPHRVSVTNTQPSWSVVMQPQTVSHPQTMYITPASQAVHYSPFLVTPETSSADHVVPLVVPEVHTIIPHQVTYTAQTSPSAHAHARAHRPHSLEGSVSGLANWVSEVVTVNSDSGHAGRDTMAAVPINMPVTLPAATPTPQPVYGSVPVYMQVVQPVTILPH